MIDTYLINLARRGDRLASFVDYYRLPFSVHVAFDGRRLEELTKRNLLDYRQKKILKALQQWPLNPPQRIPGIFGCWESHFSLWIQLISNSDSDCRILVLEDDAKATPNFEKVLLNVTSNLPSDFDFFYLGCQGNPYFRRNLPSDSQKWTKVLQDGSSIEFGRMAGDSLNTTCAYLISKKGAVAMTDYLYETLEREEPLCAIDYFIHKHQSTLHNYELLPHIFYSQIGADSDIQI